MAAVLTRTYMFSLVLGIARITQNRPTASTLPRNCGEPSGVIEAVRIGYGIERRLVGRASGAGFHVGPPGLRRSARCTASAIASRDRSGRVAANHALAKAGSLSAGGGAEGWAAMPT